jgi:hypothetical protein
MFNCSVQIFRIAMVVIVMTNLLMESSFAEQIINKSIDNKQTKTFGYLKNFMETSKPKWRIKVEDAEGEEEILASRIYLAFKIASFPRSLSDPSIKKNAWKELNRNYKLTITLLAPIVNEGLNYELEKEWMQPEARISVYLTFLCRIARIEKDKFALNILKNLTKHPNDYVSQYAEFKISVYKKENLKIFSQQYKETRQLAALQWIKKNYLEKKISTISRDDIEDVLGQGKLTTNYKYAYLAKGEYVYQYLLITFHDQYFAKCEWAEVESVKF